MKKIVNLILVCGAALVLGPACCAQDVVSDQTDSDVTLSGIVRDPSGKPAPGAQVTFYPGRYAGAPGITEVTTDKNGRYKMIVNAQRDSGVIEISTGVMILTNCLVARDLAQNLAAIQEFTETPTNMDLSLEPGLRLSGFVTDTKGTPLNNVPVAVSMLASQWFVTFKPQSGKTDETGLFSIPALPQGRIYYLNGITAPGYGSLGASLKAEETRTNHYEFPTFVLKPADRKLAGQVLGADGKPVEGAKVTFNGVGQPPWKAEREETDAQGHFVIEGVCEGPVAVSASADNMQGSATAQGGDTNVLLRLGISVGISQSYLRPPAKTTGTVRDSSGAPAAGVAMSLFPVQVQSLKAETDSAGKYEFNWQARLDMEETQWLLARDPKRNLAAVHQVNTNTTNLDLTLQEGLTLSIQAQDESGHAVPGASVTVSIQEGNRGFGISPLPVTADDTGHLRVTALPQGQHYMVWAEAPGYGMRFVMVELEDTKTNFFEMPPIFLAPARPAADAASSSRTIKGRVLDADGKPVASVALELIPLIADHTWRSVKTDADGGFTFSGVPATPVFINAGPVHVGGSQTNWFGNVQVNPGVTEVVVQLGVNDNRYTPAESVTTSGLVLDPSDAPAPWVSLSVLGSLGGQPVQSDAGGNYRLQWQTWGGRTNDQRRIVLYASDPARNLAATAELNTTSLHLDLRLQPALTLSGTAQDPDGKPVGHATVQLVPFPPAERNSAMNRQAPTNAAADGSFALSGMARGAPYLLHVSAEGYGSNNIPVPARDTQTNELKLPPIVLKPANQQVSGQVVGPDGKPYWGAQIIVTGGEGQPAGHPSTSDSNGFFHISEICKGPVDVHGMPPIRGSNYPFRSGFTTAQGGDTNVVIRLGYSNGVPIPGPGGLNPAGMNRPSPAPSR